MKILQKSCRSLPKAAIFRRFSLFHFLWICSANICGTDSMGFLTFRRILRRQNRQVFEHSGKFARMLMGFRVHFVFASGNIAGSNVFTDYGFAYFVEKFPRSWQVLIASANICGSKNIHGGQSNRFSVRPQPSIRYASKLLVVL